MRKLLLASAAMIGAATAAQAQVNLNTSPAPSVPGVNAAANSMPALAPGQIVVRMNGRLNWYTAFVADGDANAQYWTNNASTNPAPTTSAWGATLTRDSSTSTTTVGASSLTSGQTTTNTTLINPVTGGVTNSTSTTNNNGPTNITNNVTSYVSFSNQRPGNRASFLLSPTAAGGAGYSASGANSVMVRAKNNQGVSMASYIRLYPGFDGMMANGLRYGVAAEIRQENLGPSGGGARYNISASNNVRGALYWRRAYGYVASPDYGTLRFGSGDGPAGLFMTGNFENMNDGGWNGDLPSFFGTAGPAWPFADVGTIYTTNKVVYLSPQFAGFDVGMSWAPTSNSMSNVSGCSFLGTASVGCDRLSSIDSSGNTREQLRQHDFFEAMVRYRGTFGGVGISAYGGWFGSSSIHTGNTLYTTFSPTTTYKDNSIGVGGAQISYAGFAVGGMVQGGDYNRFYAPAPQGTDGSLAWLVGASYTTGPIIVGGHYWEHTTPGAYVPGAGTSRQTASSTVGVDSEQKERGLALGATYAVAPGFSLFLSYVWGDRHQGGVNLLTGQTGTVSGTNGGTSTTFGQFNKNTLTVQAISIGTQLRW